MTPLRAVATAQTAPKALNIQTYQYQVPRPAFSNLALSTMSRITFGHLYQLPYGAHNARDLALTLVSLPMNETVDTRLDPREDK